MLRNALALMLTLLAVSNLRAQDWATKMFETTSHDFGSVARGAKAQFRFKLNNPYREDVHVASVRSSCNCTMPLVTKLTLKTFEEGEVVADLNTRDFSGLRTATITVKFDKPVPAEVQLNIKAVIRTDVVLTPSALDFGNVDSGTKAEKKLLVSYAGRDNWQLMDARTADPHFQVEMTELSRGGGKVTYELLVRLTDDAPVGYVNDQLILVTNDTQAADLPVDMTGQVVSSITVSPSPLFIGSVRLGQTVTKSMIVRGRKPFKIVGVKCSDENFSVTPSDRSATFQKIPVEFTATEAGKISRKIVIETDLGPEATATFVAFADVVKPSDNRVVKTNRAKSSPSDDGGDTDGGADDQ